MPTPSQYLAGKKVDRGVTNIRQTTSSHWRGWIGPKHRCLVPFTSFAENAGPVRADLFGFLTSAPNAEVAAVHPKAMRVILTEPGQWGTWLAAPFSEAKALQRPLPDGSVHIVLRSEKKNLLA